MEVRGRVGEWEKVEAFLSSEYLSMIYAVCVYICRWSKREEQDFARVVAYYGVVFNSEINKYDWSQFR